MEESWGYYMLRASYTNLQSIFHLPHAHFSHAYLQRFRQFAVVALVLLISVLLRVVLETRTRSRSGGGLRH